MIVKRKDSSGAIRYGARVSVSGERKWLGTFDRLKDANEAARRAHDLSPKAGPTCGEFARTWLAQDCPRTSGRQLKTETLREYSYRLRAFQREFENETLSAVRRDQAFQWSLLHRYDVAFVAALFSHAHDLGLVGTNPFAGLGLSKGKGRKHNVPLTETQLYELADAAYGVKGTEWAPYAAQFRAFILFQAFTGLRPGETFELRWSDIEGDRIHVRRRLGKYGTVDLPKSGVQRVVLLPPPAHAALATFPRSLDLVFRGVRGQRLARGCAFRYFKKVREAASEDDEGNIVKPMFRDLDLYSLRHFCAHYLYVQMEVPARVVAAQMGHNDGGRLVEVLYGHGEVGALEVMDDAWKERRYHAG